MIEAILNGERDPHVLLQKNQLTFNAQIVMQHIVGVDLCAVPAISEITALELISGRT